MAITSLGSFPEYVHMYLPTEYHGPSQDLVLANALSLLP